MAVAIYLYLASRFMTITNQPSELEVWNFVWEMANKHI
jgi:hypothetical protein